MTRYIALLHPADDDGAEPRPIAVGYDEHEVATHGIAHAIILGVDTGSVVVVECDDLPLEAFEALEKLISGFFNCDGEHGGETVH